MEVVVLPVLEASHVFIGVDVGVNGGIAAIDQDGRVVRALSMPQTESDILGAFGWFAQQLRLRNATYRAMLERVRSSPQMGVVSAFTFGAGYGGLRMALTAAQCPFDEVAPGVWQRSLSCRSGGDKNITKRRAQELFPVKITHAIADALLLAEYCRRTHRPGPRA